MSIAPYRLLMIEDDHRLSAMVKTYLEQSEFLCVVADTGAAGFEALQAETPDAVLLDLMLPDTDGLSICRQIRGSQAAYANVPILMLTAKGDPMDRIVGLELGADDYLPKPFEPRELLARLRAILRRTGTEATTKEPDRGGGPRSVTFGSLALDLDAREVRVGGVLRELTAYQFDLLVALSERAGRVLTREQIMALVRGKDLEAFDRSIDVHIGRIRQAIEADIKNPKRISTVRGVGYVFAKHHD
jgi:DNA-binding response OmpR family regulator